jgi:hypothetical protein
MASGVPLAGLEPATCCLGDGSAQPVSTAPVASQCLACRGMTCLSSENRSGGLPPGGRLEAHLLRALADRPTRLLAGRASGQHASGRVLVAVVGMPSWLSAVHRQMCPLLGVHPTRPAVQGPSVQPSGVQPVQCPAIWLPRPDAAVQPAGVQPVRRPAVWCLSVRSPPSRPASAGCWRWGDLGTAGQRSCLDRVEFPCGPARPWRLGRRPEEAWLRVPLRRWCAGRRGASAADLGRVVLGREAASERPGRPDCRQGAVAGDCARVGGWLARCGAWQRAGRPSGLEPRLLYVVIAEADGRADGPGRIKRGRRAAPARPSQVATATGSTLATL